MITAYLIDPARRTVEPVTYSDIADLQRLLDCSTVGTSGWFDSNHLCAATNRMDAALPHQNATSVCQSIMRAPAPFVA